MFVAIYDLEIVDMIKTTKDLSDLNTEGRLATRWWQTCILTYIFVILFKFTSVSSNFGLIGRPREWMAYTENPGDVQLLIEAPSGFYMPTV